jgi:hypothetical protein
MGYAFICCMHLIRHLYISPGHNYFGRHGKLADCNPIIEVDAIECVAGQGIIGDRFFNFKENYKGQITFFSYEVYQELCLKLQVHDKTPSVFRRNVVTFGIELNHWIGKTFEIQGMEFYGVEECRPCYWMEQAFGTGAENLLKGYGGLRANILTDGVLKKYV